MLKIIKLLICFTAANVSAQVSPQQITSTIENSQNHNLIDSIAKVLNYKDGDKIKVLTQFNVGADGSLVNIVARAPHPVFEAEAIRVLKEVKLDLPKDEVEYPKFSLPIVFVIETEKEKKKRLKKEKKKDKRLQKSI